MAWLYMFWLTTHNETDGDFSSQFEEYMGRGAGKSYGKEGREGPHGSCLLWGGVIRRLTLGKENYKKRLNRTLRTVIELRRGLHAEPHRMLEHEVSALVLVLTGWFYGWFTGVGTA